MWYDNKLKTKKHAIKKTFGKRFAIPLDFNFFKNSVCKI